jgi:hypothetical protein
MDNVENTGNRKQQLRKQYGQLYDDVLAILNKHDPMGIAYQPDEYEMEVVTILPRLKEAHSALELRRIIHEEFIHWFSMFGYSPGEPIPDHHAGPEEQYTAIAQEIWMRIHGGANGS